MTAGKDLLAGVSFSGSRRFELSLSENPFPPLPSVLHAVEDVLRRVNRYPEFRPERLPRLIANRIGVPTDQVIVGSGATGVAMQAVRALVHPGQNMVFSSPTFDGYPIMAEMAEIRAITVPLDGGGRQDLSAMLAAMDEDTGLAIVVRPHNPTGTLIPGDELAAFLHAVPPGVVVILDEAYVEFVAGPDAIDARDIVTTHPNVLVLRTFSKAFGLAGLRIGYAFGVPELAARVRRQQLPFGVNVTAVAAVAASYAAERELADRIAWITHERDALRHALLHIGLTVPPSHANFLYLPGPDAAERLGRAGIGSKVYPDGSARIAAGDPAAGRAVLEALLLPTPFHDDPRVVMGPATWWGA